MQPELIKNYDLDLNKETRPFNQFLVPSGIYARAQFKIHGGGCIKKIDQMTNTMKLALYINVEFTLLDDPYAGHTISQMIGLQGLQRECAFENLWAAEGRAMIRAIVESARNIHPADTTDTAQQARKLTSFEELQGLACAIKVGLTYDQADKLKLRNKVSEIITPVHSLYHEIMQISPIK